MKRTNQTVRNDFGLESTEAWTDVKLETLPELEVDWDYTHKENGFTGKEK